MRHDAVGAAGAPVDERPRILAVAGEQLVAAFAGEHDLDVLAGELGHEIERHARRVRDRLVLVPDQAGQRAEEVVLVDDDLVRVGLDRGRHLPRVIELAERALLESDREGLQRPIDHPRHQRGDGAAVETAGEEHAERHVGHQPDAHRLFEPGAELLHGVLLGELCEALVAATGRHVPVLAGRDRAVLEDERVAGQQPVNALEQRLGAREVARAEQLGQARLVGLGANQPALEDRLDLRPEQQPAAGYRPVERLDAEAIAREQQPAARGVPDGEGEHAAQVLDAGVAPLLVGVDDRFRVGARAIAVAGRLEHRAGRRRGCRSRR